MSSPKAGFCALTGEYDDFVKAHIIPKSLTRPSERGAPLMESTQGKGFKRKWSSWFDDSFLCAEGERILAEIDDKGIKALRQNRLIWSSQNPAETHQSESHEISSDHTLKKMKLNNADAVWLLAVSIAWRACASDRAEMQHAFAPEASMERMKSAVLRSKETLFSSIPVSLVVLTTKGEIHNQTPYTDIKTEPNLRGRVGRTYHIVRVYLDGLIFHVHLEPEDIRSLENSSVYVGYGQTILVTGITYEASFQKENLTVLAFESVFGPINQVNWDEPTKQP